ncbi:MAG: hypothetical protein RL616_1991 [Verrucomicrobiota bacterium]
MVFLRRWLLIWSLLVLGGGQVFAASREERAYATAVADFKTEMWSRAETEFAQFTRSYPKSTNAPAAVLLQAQAQFKQGKFASVITLLDSRKATAGNLADQYANWIGEAQFANKNFPAAAAAFESLDKKFPESPLRLRAVVEAAAAYQQLGDWTRLSALLEATNGVFAKKAELDAANELVSRGRLLLAQARFTQRDFAGALRLLQQLDTQALKPELDWQRAHLLCEVKSATGELEAAFAAATNLTQIAQLEKNDAHRAESVGLRAGILEKLGRTEEALAAYQENLAPNTPDANQRQAVLKIAELAAGLNQFAEAERAQENFLRQFPNSPQADIALLTLGELHLKEYAMLPDTNQLRLAEVQFDQLLAKFPGSTLAGKAFLNRGWCRWLAGKEAESLADFQSAAQKNLSPDDLAVARFKMGDAQFAQKNFRGALVSYDAVLQNISGEASAAGELAGRARYQSLRANLELNDGAGAGAAFEKLFQKFSDGELGQNSALLYGESLVNPADARALFKKLAPKFSGALLEPQLRLAIARTLEQEQAWPAAVTNYEAWLHDFPTNTLRPQADYALAQASFHAGNEAGALAQFTQFVAQNPTNTTLAPLAQWWVADHFFRAGEFIGAETNYEAVFQNPAWKTSALFYPAQLMAGRAAMGRTGYKDATVYFNALIGDTNCPTDIGVKARFASGAALMLMDSSDTNNTLANLQLATNLFSQIIQANPTNELGARAWGALADGEAQMGDYFSATNAYAQVFRTNSAAGISARSRAQFGCGLVLEKMAAQTSGVEQTNLLALALDNYLQVFNGDNLRDEAEQDLFWTKKAGLQAASLVGLLNQPGAEKKFYERLKTLLPQLSVAVKKKLAALPGEKN